MIGFDAMPVAFCVGLGGLFGCLVGSFLNVAAHRLPAMVLAECEGRSAGMSLALPASHCPACETPLSWRENIPLVSYLLQGGRCRHCRSRIAWRYPALEALGGVAGGYAVWRFGFGVEGALLAIFLLALLTLAVIDLETRLLPDRITLPLAALGLAIAGAGYGPSSGAALAGAALGYGLLTGLNQLARLTMGQDGMGGGDAKLAAALGAWLGPAPLIWALLLAFAGGAIFGVLLRAIGGGKAATAADGAPAGSIAFGPWLAVGGAVAAGAPELVAAGASWLMTGGF